MLIAAPMLVFAADFEVSENPVSWELRLQQRLNPFICYGLRVIASGSLSILDLAISNAHTGTDPAHDPILLS
jgi:hypothetical protein